MREFMSLNKYERAGGGLLMNGKDRRFWPFRPRTSIAFTVLILVCLLIIFVFLRATKNWPSEKSEPTVLIGILLISLLPVLLALVDVIIERGGVIKAGGVEIDFSKVPQIGMSGFSVPINVGLPDYAVDSSHTPDIFNAFNKIALFDVAIIDLKEGQAWWETRLLVLLAGAVRRKKPEKVVFVAKDGSIDKCFQGWGHPRELLPCLLRAHSQYPMSYHKAMAAARQWEMVEPTGDIQNPPQPPYGPLGLAGQHSWMAFDNTTGLPNPLFAEQLLAYDLGSKVESEEKPKRISLVRLEELFRPVLHKESIDERWSAERQLNEFLNSDSDFLAITQNGKYLTMVSRLTVLNSIVRTLVEKK
jgi:hypothetical protein